jgi:hypothetical protein
LRPDRLADPNEPEKRRLINGLLDPSGGPCPLPRRSGAPVRRLGFDPFAPAAGSGRRRGAIGPGRCFDAVPASAYICAMKRPAP